MSIGISYFFSLLRRCPLFLVMGSILPCLIFFYWLNTAAIVQAEQLSASRAQSTSPFQLASTDSVRFAAVGDYGLASQGAERVADLIKSWSVDFITTLGDNNYPSGEERHIDENVGQFYHEFLYPYTGRFGVGSDTQRFFPVLGNHDWESIYCSGAECSGPYFDYFSIPTDHRYYTFQQGPVRFFMLDSDSNEPDGISGLSTQAMWLRDQLAQSDATWNLVYLHHPPFSSGGHRSHELLQWPYAQWGADAVLAGHNHVYERIFMDDMLFFVNGLGGKSRHHLRDEQPNWVQSRYNADDGAMLIEATTEAIHFQFIDVNGVVRDSYSLASNHQEESSIYSASPHQTVAISIEAAGEDAVESLTTGTISSNGYVLDIGETAAERTLVGFRFTGVNIPKNAVVVSAFIELTTQNDNDKAATFNIAGEKGCSAKAFDLLPHSLSQRVKTSNFATWEEVPQWKRAGESHITVDISAIVQEVVDEPGWQAGNAMAYFLWGDGTRRAVAYELQPKAATQLNITYEVLPRSLEPQEDPAALGHVELPSAHGLYLPLLISDPCPGR